MIYFTYMDLKHNQVENQPILTFILIGIAYSITSGKFIITALIMLSMLILGYFLWRIKVFGGADAKILPGMMPFLLIGYTNILAGLWFFWIIMLIVGTLYGLMARKILKRPDAPFLPVLLLSYVIFWFYFIR